MKDEEGYRLLLSTKDLDAYAASSTSLAPAFRHDGIVACADEGLNKGLHALGGGILMDELELQNFIEKSRAIGLTSHAECGAARLAFGRNRGLTPTELSKVSWTEVDDFAQDWTQKTARKFGLACRHISTDKMRRPQEFHPARVIYFSAADGGFNPHAIDEFPSGFVVLRYYHTGSDAALEELKICLSIALGNHGQGVNFTSEEPLLIVVIGHEMYPWQHRDYKMSIVREFIDQNLASEDRERILVKGFTAPTKYLHR
jgi:hypothetical protein